MGLEGFLKSNDGDKEKQAEKSAEKKAILKRSSAELKGSSGAAANALFIEEVPKKSKTKEQDLESKEELDYSKKRETFAVPHGKAKLTYEFSEIDKEATVEIDIAWHGANKAGVEFVDEMYRDADGRSRVMSARADKKNRVVVTIANWEPTDWRDPNYFENLQKQIRADLAKKLKEPDLKTEVSGMFAHSRGGRNAWRFAPEMIKARKAAGKEPPLLVMNDTVGDWSKFPGLVDAALRGDAKVIQVAGICRGSRPATMKVLERLSQDPRHADKVIYNAEGQPVGFNHPNLMIRDIDHVPDGEKKYLEGQLYFNGVRDGDEQALMRLEKHKDLLKKHGRVDHTRAKHWTPILLAKMTGDRLPVPNNGDGVIEDEEVMEAEAAPIVSHGGGGALSGFIGSGRGAKKRGAAAGALPQRYNIQKQMKKGQFSAAEIRNPRAKAHEFKTSVPRFNPNAPEYLRPMPKEVEEHFASVLDNDAARKEVTRLWLRAKKRFRNEQKAIDFLTSRVNLTMRIESKQLKKFLVGQHLKKDIERAEQFGYAYDRPLFVIKGHAAGSGKTGEGRGYLISPVDGRVDPDDPSTFSIISGPVSIGTNGVVLNSHFKNRESQFGVYRLARFSDKPFDAFGPTFMRWTGLESKRAYMKKHGVSRKMARGNDDSFRRGYALHGTNEEELLDDSPVTAESLGVSDVPAVLKAGGENGSAGCGRVDYALGTRVAADVRAHAEDGGIFMVMGVYEEELGWYDA